MLAGLFKGKNIYRIIVTIIVLVALFTLPQWAKEYYVLIGMLICLYFAVGSMWNLLLGYAGLLSLGNQLFIGLGGYALAVTSNFYGIPIMGGLLIGAVISAIMAALQALVFFRMKGMYFAIASWITAEAFIIIFANWTYVQGGIGMCGKAAYGLGTADIYYMALILAVCVFVLVLVLLRSKLGLGLMAMRDSYEAAGTVGVHLFKSRMITFVIAGFVTGLSGGVIYLQQVSIAPKSGFSIAWTVAIVFVVVIGGIGTVAGPIAGAIIYVILNQYLSAFPGYSMIILGAIAVAVILTAPKGVIGTLQQRLGFELLSPRRALDP